MGLGVTRPERGLRDRAHARGLASDATARTRKMEIGEKLQMHLRSLVKNECSRNVGVLYMALMNAGS